MDTCSPSWTRSPRTAEGWTLLAQCVQRGKDAAAVIEEVRSEYTRLFLGPAQPAVYPYESYYRGGALLGEALLGVRAFLRQVGFERGEGSSEPEDHVAVELDMMRQLIAKGESTSGAQEEQWYHLQGTFLRRHLLPWVPQLCLDVESQEMADFYRPVAKILRGFLELEAQVLEGWGSSEAGEPEAPRVLPWAGPTIEVDESPAADPG